MRVEIQLHHALKFVSFFGCKAGKFGQNTRIVYQNIGIYAVFGDKIKESRAVDFACYVADEGRKILSKLLADGVKPFLTARKTNNAAAVFRTKKL